jgi:hypothetical protein
MRVELELRNLPLARLGEYLVAAGGRLTDARHASGAGWSAVITALPPATLGVMRIPRDLLVIEGDDDVAVEAVRDAMRRHTMRGGG